MSKKKRMSPGGDGTAQPDLGETHEGQPCASSAPRKPHKARGCLDSTSHKEAQIQAGDHFLRLLWYPWSFLRAWLMSKKKRINPYSYKRKGQTLNPQRTTPLYYTSSEAKLGLTNDQTNTLPPPYKPRLVVA